MAISNGQETLRQASKYLGSEEGQPNRSGDPIVDACQKMYGLQGVPWCACFVGYCIANSRANAAYKRAAADVVHPSTAVMVDRARRKGWLDGHSRHTKPGDLFIIDGLHVGFINVIRNDGLFSTIEGNQGNSVTSMLRSWNDGWQVISFPGVGQPGKAALVEGFGFDDKRVKLFGGWTTPEQRNKEMKKYKAANEDHWTQAIRVLERSPFAFRAGPKGTYNRWSFGPWLHKTGKEIRDEKMKAWSEANAGAATRPWKKNYREN